MAYEQLPQYKPTEHQTPEPKVDHNAQPDSLSVHLTLPRKSGHSRRVDNRGECSNDTKTTQDLYRRAEG
jgi:hypothetical protein